jgi:hypothetical protein
MKDFAKTKLYKLMKEKFENGENPIKLYQEDFDEYQRVVWRVYDKAGLQNVRNIYTFRGINVIAI